MTHAPECRDHPSDSAASVAKFDGFQIRDFSGLHGEEEDSSHQMPAVMAAGAGVHVNQAQCGVAHHLQNMGVAADEKAGFDAGKISFHAGVVVAGVAADMGHVDAEPFAIPAEVLGQVGAEFGAINVAVHSPDWFEFSKLIEDLRGSEVTSVPELIAVGKVGEKCFVQKAMRVREQADSHAPCWHNRRLC
jgi:hypothetical protein